MLRYNLAAQHRYVRWRMYLAEWQHMERWLPGLEVRRGTLQELAHFRETWQDSPLPYDFYADELYGLHWFYLSFWESQLANIVWLALTPDTCTVANLNLQPGEVEMRNGYTIPHYRGRRILTYAHCFILDDLKQAGMHTVYTHVEETNRASLSASGRLGFQPVGIVARTRVMGMEWLRYVAHDHLDVDCERSW
jgi:RimJ/RimL family protein N-acetyltransferase